LNSDLRSDTACCVFWLSVAAQGSVLIEGNKPMITIDDAIEYIIEQMLSPRKTGHDHGLGDDDHSVIMINIIQNYIRREHPQVSGSELYQYFPTYSQHFLDAAHELSRRGVFRIGPHRMERNGESLKKCYVLTEFGQKWIDTRKTSGVPPMEPGRYPQLIAEYAKLFGSGFQQRATEAIKCYQAQAYLACCAMVGAAAESILLYVAINKSGDEIEVLKKYGQSGGAGKIKNDILAGKKSSERQHFEGIYELMKYWRDESAHGKQSNLSELEAHMSLFLLIRHATFVRDQIAVYTQK